MFNAAVAAADPAKVLAHYLPPAPGHCIVVGAGKAAGSMAVALDEAWPEVELRGVVVTPYGYGTSCKRIHVREAGHPIPDESSVAAAREMLSAVEGLRQDDLVIALISGGGSSALALPAAGITLQDKQIVNRLLLGSGLDIRTMNAVRRRISAIKGGKLAAAAAPAKVITLAISDIPGDDPTAIASGPTTPNGVTMDLCSVAERLGPELPRRVAELLCSPELPAAVSGSSEIRLIATPADALHAAARVASAAGIIPVVLGDDIEGESRLVARDMIRHILQPVQSPTVLISGGETTVKLDGAPVGRGGRNTEFLLQLATDLAGSDRIWAIAADTDGHDGANLGAAGAIITPSTIARARSAGFDPLMSLNVHDSGSLFAGIEDLVITGPTRTNVNDFRAVLVLPERK
jgi:hydroxypyruvate reductase